MSVYINSTGRYLPGPPIDNDNIERVLGLVNGKPSRLKKRILNSNGIRKRHFAMDAEHNTLESNAELAGKAANACLDAVGFRRPALGLLSAATSQGDLVLPGFGSMVQAELALEDVELHTSHGICSSSMMALKHAFLSVKAGEQTAALVVASELSSRLFKASRYEAAGDQPDFNAEFLRWMLSDGAGALLLENKPGKKSLRIDWIQGFSHADAYPECMTVGRPRMAHSQKSWQDYPTYAEAEAEGALLIRQDVRLLENVVKLGVDGFLRVMDKHQLTPDNIDHVLCHYSSDHFRGKIFEMLTAAGMMVPESRWYTNLYERGNTGCASLFIMLDEFLHTQTYHEGETILCMVPESGRFNNVYMQLTVVNP